MKMVNDTYYELKNRNYYKKQFDNGEGKRNVLFVDPVMHNFDLYTMIMPYLSMEDETHRTAMTGMYKYSEIDEKPATIISHTEVKWASVIVIPMSLENFTAADGLFQDLRSTNPEIKIIHTVEFDYYEMTNDHPALQFSEEIKKKLTPEKIKEIKEKMIIRYAENCAGADRIMVLNSNLAQKLNEKGFSDVKRCPILIDQEMFSENINFDETMGIKNTAGIVFMSIELSESSLSAFKGYIPILKKIKQKYQDKFRLIIITVGKGKSLFKGLDFKVGHIAKNSIINQYNAIVKSSADFHLVLNRNNKYFANTEPLFTYVERGMFGIPIVSIPVSPYKEIIKHEENGYIIKKKSDLLDLVGSMIKDKKKLIKLSSRLKEDVTKHFQIDDEKTEYLMSVFFDGYSFESE